MKSTDRVHIVGVLSCQSKDVMLPVVNLLIDSLICDVQAKDVDRMPTALPLR